MIIYISGKITDNPKYMSDFAKASDKVKAEYDAKVINPAQISMLLPISEMSWDDFILIDERFIDCSDAVYFMANWRESRGACYELAYAKAKGKLLIFENKDDEELGEGFS